MINFFGNADIVCLLLTVSEVDIDFLSLGLGSSTLLVVHLYCRLSLYKNGAVLSFPAVEDYIS